MEDKNYSVIDTDSKRAHGTNRCPKCGASDLTYDIKRGNLICNYCYTDFKPSDVEGVEKFAKNLSGEMRTSGTNDIKDNNDIITIKCSGCGAEVVINTKENMNVRCHWCRSLLSVNSQVENGAVPDYILPFKLDKNFAKKKIEDFVKCRRFYAESNFKKEFSTDNIMGVYFPYLLVDANCHASFSGEGGHVIRTYTIVTGKDKDGNEEKETVYDIDLYHVERDFDIFIDDLSIESSMDKLNKNNIQKTTNVINSIMPFDTENCVKYESNYLVGFTSEKRDVNVDDLKNKVNQLFGDIARHSINADLKFYNSGIRWENENLVIKGQQWVSSYLPVWLYSYKDGKNVIHYVVVNGRTGETMGSVPINKFKLVLMSILLFFVPFIFPLLFFLLMLFFDIEINPFFVSSAFLYFCLVIGIVISFIFYFITLNSYRNSDKRHRYEVETKNTITNINRVDSKIRCLRERSFSRISGVNNHRVVGEFVKVDNNK